MQQFRTWLRSLASLPSSFYPPILILCGIAVAWLLSMPTTIVITNDPLQDPTGTFDGLLQLLDDSGEFVIAWHTWGITHAPGYPLLSLVANIGVRLLDPFTLYPAVAAHLLSFLFALGAFVLMGWPIFQLEKSGTAVAAAYLLPAFGILVWLYAVVAEAYAFGLLLAFGTLGVAFAVGKQPTKRRILLLGLLFGLAVGHHRTLIFLTPALLSAAWPARQLGWRIWVYAGLLAAASLLIYLYLPVVTWAGSPWVYGRSPTTWSGFLDAFVAREYSSRLTPPQTLPEIVAALDGRLRFLAQEMTGFNLSLGLFGFLPGLIQPKTRHLAFILLLAFFGYWLAPVSQSLLIRSYMMILLASLTLAASWGVGLAAMNHWHAWAPIIGLLLTVGGAINTFRTHQPYIYFHTKDQVGAQFMADAARLPDERPIVGEVWGPRFFPFAYGQLVTGDLAHIQLYDLRSDLGGLPQDLPQTIYTTQDVLYAIHPDRWAEKYGTAVALSNVGNRLVAIQQSPVLEPVSFEAQNNGEIVLKQGTAVLTDHQTVIVELTWQATQKPTNDYSIFVHVTDKEAILSSEDIIAQGDRAHPVSGFYPTTHWVYGELVQDNYLIPLPEDRFPQRVVIGLYTVDANSNFNNHLVQTILIEQLP